MREIDKNKYLVLKGTEDWKKVWRYSVNSVMQYAGSLMLPISFLCEMTQSWNEKGFV
jgi:hypothetical protein